MTAEELEALVAADYEALKGSLIRTTEVECCNNNDCTTMFLSEPITLRVVSSLVLFSWRGDWIDPAYDVELVESTPEADAWLADGDWHVSWVYGPSRNLDGRYDKPRFVVRCPVNG